MSILFALITVLGLAIFEIVSSVDNAIINAQVLSTMGERMKKIFLRWGILVAVFLMRGLLPWLIVWVANPSLGPGGAITASFSSDPKIKSSIEESAPLLLIAGGTFLLFLFFNWFFREDKSIAIKGEKAAMHLGIWFYAIVSLLLCVIVWFAVHSNPLMGFAAVIGASVYFISHGFKEKAQAGEQSLKKGSASDLTKLLYLEVIDATFSIDGVLGSFAFTLSVPIILLGNGIGAFVVRQLTASHIQEIQKYIYLENGAMYSIFCLGCVMLLDSFKVPIPEYVSPIITFIIVGYFFSKSKKAIR